MILLQVPDCASKILRAGKLISVPFSGLAADVTLANAYQHDVLRVVS